ncbi:RNA-directed DNA polymerase, eukaryota, reverse transcriptase zinc-binding domain protein [Tanacetum coccineum]
MERRQLWTELGLHKHLVRGHPWILMGDFNVSLNMEDNFSGSLVMDSVMCDFKDYVNNIEVFDINSFGLHFTWNQKPKGRDGVLKKLDRIMGNIDFVDVYPGAYAIFQPYRISDHSPCVLKIPSLSASKPKPFKVVKKLKSLKKPFRKLMHEQGNLHKRVIRLRNELDEVQKALDHDPANSELRDEEAVYVQAFNNAMLDEERFLRQKAKIEWNHVPNVFVSHYMDFLGSDMMCDELDSDDLVLGMTKGYVWYWG